MKYFNYVVSVLVCSFSLYLFITSKSDFDIVVSFTVMISGIIFFLFGVIEEHKEETERLRQIILNRGDFK